MRHQTAIGATVLSVGLAVAMSSPADGGTGSLVEAGLDNVKITQS